MPCGRFPELRNEEVGQDWVNIYSGWGQSLINVGEKRPCFATNGVDAWMTFQATTKVQKPLAAATRITEKGNRIVLDGAGSENYIQNKKTGKNIPLSLENGVYMMQILVKPAPLQGQAK